MYRAFLLRIAYDGTEFFGWQRQPEARTVQATVEQALQQLCGSFSAVHAAGRTDSGVHAAGLAASCRVPLKWSARSLRRGLNALLPIDCRVIEVVETIPEFHARKSALRRDYRYLTGTGEEAESPFRFRWEWRIPDHVRLDLLMSCAQTIVGNHDFRRYSVQKSTRNHYRCDVTVAEWGPRCGVGGWELVISANRFLHHMVRMLVGTMVDVAAGRRDFDEFQRLLEGDLSISTSPPAPAKGLYFLGAAYADSCFLADRDP